MGPTTVLVVRASLTRPGVASPEFSRVTRLSKPRDDYGSPAQGQLKSSTVPLKSKILICN